VPDDRRERWLFALAVGALVLPLVVLAMRVLVHDWSNPGGDIALIELRTRDVGAHTPLLGSYGRYGFNQPGALWFYALALPYRLLGSRYAGLQLGVLAVNVAAIVTIVAIARRRGGVVAMLVVTALLGVLLHGLGGDWLADPWEPHALTLLCAVLLFLAWDAAMGGRVSLVATAGLRIYLSYITQTGYTYGALATPIAFLLFAFFLGFAIMIGAELNNAIEEEFPAPDTHANQLRSWLESRSNGKSDEDTGGDAGDGTDAPAAPERVSPA